MNIDTREILGTLYSKVLGLKNIFIRVPSTMTIYKFIEREKTNKEYKQIIGHVKLSRVLSSKYTYNPNAISNKNFKLIHIKDEIEECNATPVFEVEYYKKKNV